MDRPSTGIRDCNDKEIYEGDIIWCSSWWWGARFVYLNRGSCGPCEGDSVMSYILAKDIENPKRGATHNIWNGREVEIIGNIIDSPELIGFLSEKQREEQDEFRRSLPEPPSLFDLLGESNGSA